MRIPDFKETTILSYKVLFSGTFETGKTTLLERFIGNKSIETISEVPRDLLLNNSKLKLQANFQDMIFAEQVKRESEAEKVGKPVIICDRDILDIIAYSEVLKHKVKQEWVDHIKDRYDFVVLFGTTDIPHPLRKYDLEIDVVEYRSNVDKKIRELITRYNLRFLEVRGSADAREKIIRNHLIRHAGIH